MAGQGTSKHKHVSIGAEGRHRNGFAILRSALGRLFLYLILLLVMILAGSLRWGKANFGNVTVDQLIFTIQMPLEGTSSELVEDYLSNVLAPILAVWGVLMLMVLYPLEKRLFFTVSLGKRTWRLGLLPLRISARVLEIYLAGALFAIFVDADRTFELRDYLVSSIRQSRFIEDHYVSPLDVSVTFPEEKKNLICVYLESMESSAQDKVNGGLFDVNYIPELTRIAKENVSFSQSELIEGSAVTPGCSWTIAGLVAQTSGMVSKLPLKYDLRNTYTFFLPGVCSLGEILEKEGYRNYFMAGSDFNFGGRKRYFTSHGNYEILDLDWARRTGHVPIGYKVSWGFEDAKLYEFAKEQLARIAAEDEPFNFSLLTVDTHTPSGYLCELCPDLYDQKYANVYACASRQLSGFLDWVNEQEWGKDTVIYISGDHLSMDPDFYGGYVDVDYTGETGRKVYNAFLHSAVVPAAESGRKFTTLDMFPSILGAMGVKIEGERLGLGTNLFSEMPTLAEEFGYEVLFDELKRRSLFYEEKFLYP